MKNITKIYISIATILIVMLALPLYAVHFAQGYDGMGLLLILFFVGNPLELIFLGVIAGTNVKQLWWIPILALLVFPLLFGLAIWDYEIATLYLYSIMYLFPGMIAMFATHFARKIKAKSKKEAT